MWVSFILKPKLLQLKVAWNNRGQNDPSVEPINSISHAVMK
jgi:hypothetical protein